MCIQSLQEEANVADKQSGHGEQHHPTPPHPPCGSSSGLSRSSTVGLHRLALSSSTHWPRSMALQGPGQQGERQGQGEVQQHDDMATWFKVNQRQMKSLEVHGAGQ